MTGGRGLAILCVLGLAGLACGLGDPNDRLMTDDELIATFRSERSAFDSLATMLGEDRNIRFLDSYALYLDRGDTANSYQLPGASTPGMPGERRDAYERLLRRIRVGRNVWSDSSGILFQRYVCKLGPVEGRWMQGYYFARKPLPTPCPRDRRSRFTANSMDRGTCTRCAGTRTTRDLAPPPQSRLQRPGASLSGSPRIDLPASAVAVP
jgi:hypothetical protein